MPLERREILFYLNEAIPILDAGRSAEAGNIPPFLDDGNLIEVAHTRDLSVGFHDRRQRLESLLGHRPQCSGLVFRGLRRSIVGAGREFAFLVPDNVMITLLISACSQRKIRLPRDGTKDVIAPDLMMGLRITIQDDALSLE